MQLGWSNDIRSRAKRHYYKDGVSLCGKAELKKHMTHFDSDSKGSKWAKDCVSCIKKLAELNPKTN